MREKLSDLILDVDRSICCRYWGGFSFGLESMLRARNLSSYRAGDLDELSINLVADCPWAALAVVS